MKKKDPTSHRIIEKRRRDRMNNCLADLSKLIPDVYMKKRSGRIEKTEIIEMAIKYLKDLIDLSDAQQQEERQQQQLRQQQQQQEPQQQQDHQPHQLPTSCNNFSSINNKIDPRQQLLHHQLDQQLQIQTNHGAASSQNENVEFNNHGESATLTNHVNNMVNHGDGSGGSKSGSCRNSESPSPSASTTSASSLASTSATVGSSISDDSQSYSDCQKSVPPPSNDAYKSAHHQSRYHQARLGYSASSSNSASLRAHHRSSQSSSIRSSGYNSRSSNSSINSTLSGNRSGDSLMGVGCCTCGAKILSATNLNSGNLSGNIIDPMNNSSIVSHEQVNRAGSASGSSNDADHNSDANHNSSTGEGRGNTSNVVNSVGNNNLMEQYSSGTSYLNQSSSKSVPATGWSKKAWLVRSFSRAASQQR